MSHSFGEAIRFASGDVPKGHPNFNGKMHLEGLPLDGNSELLKAMDNRMMFMGHIALVQVMQPHTGAGVANHSDVYDNALARLGGSIGMITASAFDGENGDKVAQLITSLHKPINGRLPDGILYSALNPKSWVETHLTFFQAAEQIFLRFDPRSDDSELRDSILEQMYMEYITWYQRFGIPDRHLPENYGDFKKFWQNMVENDLEMTDSAKWGFSLLKDKKFPFPTAVPELARRAMNIPLAEPTGFVGKLIMGGMPPEIRNNPDYADDLPKFTKRDEKLVQLFDSVVKNRWERLPASVRYPANDLKFMQQHGMHEGASERVMVAGWDGVNMAIKAQQSLTRRIRSFAR